MKYTDFEVGQYVSWFQGRNFEDSGSHDTTYFVVGKVIGLVDTYKQRKLKIKAIQTIKVATQEEVPHLCNEPAFKKDSSFKRMRKYYGYIDGSYSYLDDYELW
jgi:hypothetical protein